MQQLQSAVRDLERQREEERVRGEGERGEEERGEEMREVVREALHQPPLSEDEYLALRGRGEEEGKERERNTQALADYVRVSCVVSTSLTQCSHCACAPVVEVVGKQTFTSHYIIAHPYLQERSVHVCIQ